MYYFVHGFTTYACGSWMGREQTLACGQRTCAQLMQETWPAMKRGGGWECSDIHSPDCAECNAEREQRRRVMRPDGDRHTREPFVSAPCIHALGWPKYHALTLRAISFANAGAKQLVWAVAVG